jgi:DNA-binding NarL/FixJ family response regulator
MKRDASDHPEPADDDKSQWRLDITEAEWQQIGERLDITPRQVQIIRAILDGYHKPEAIAFLLGIQPSSVKTQIERLYDTLGVHNRAELVICISQQLLEIRASRA